MTRALCALLFSLVALPLLADAPAYVTSSETTLSGDVLYVADSPTGAGVFVIMKDGHNEIQVLLGPGPFLTQEGLQINVHDTLKVVGSRTIWNGGEVILARQVTAGGKTVTLRGPTGAPRW